jgi:plastocyanin
MRSLLGCALALFAFSGCGDDTTPPSFDAAAPQVDAGNADLAMPANPTQFPMAASITVGGSGANATTFRTPSGAVNGTTDIAAGGTITWNWAADNALPHNVTSADNPAAFPMSPTQEQGSFSQTFRTAGTFHYFCTIHGINVMFGTVIVH